MEENKIMSDFYVWFSGFVDGEGYFQIVKVKSQRTRDKFLYLPMMGIGLRKDDASILYKIKKQLGIGCLVPGRKQKKFKNAHPSLRWVVSGVKQSMELIRIFEKYPLQSKKKKDYGVWKSFVLQKSEHGKKLPKSMCEYYYHRIREVREYNPVLVEAYEMGLRETNPVIFH